MLKQANKRICNTEPNKICFWSMVFVALVCLFSYGYSVRGAIVNIVERQNMEANISTLSSKVLELESFYIRSKNGVNLEKAYELGFVDLTSKKFVTRNTDSVGLSLLSDSI